MRRWLRVLIAGVALVGLNGPPGLLSAAGSSAYRPFTGGDSLTDVHASPALIAFTRGGDTFLADFSGEVIRVLDPAATVSAVSTKLILLQMAVDGSPTRCFVVEPAGGATARNLCSATSAAVVGEKVVYTQGGTLYWANVTGKRHSIETFAGVVQAGGPKGVLLSRETGAGPRVDYLLIGHLGDGTGSTTKVALPDATTLVDCRSVALTRAGCRVGLEDGSEWPTLLSLTGGSPTLLTALRPSSGAYVSSVDVSQVMAVWRYQSTGYAVKVFGGGAAKWMEFAATSVASAGKWTLASRLIEGGGYEGAPLYQAMLLRPFGDGGAGLVDLRVPGARFSREMHLVASWAAALKSAEPHVGVRWFTDKHEQGTRYWLTWHEIESDTWGGLWKSGVPKGSATLGVGGDPLVVTPCSHLEFDGDSISTFGWRQGARSRVVHVACDQDQGRTSHGWRTVASAGDWNGSRAVSSRRGASFSFAFTGRKKSPIQVFGRQGTRGADFKVYVDGSLIGTFSSHSRTSKIRQILWSGTVRGPGKHTVKLVKLGGKATSLAIDGYHTP